MWSSQCRFISCNFQFYIFILVQTFTPLEQVWVSCVHLQHFATFYSVFLFAFFKIRLKPLLGLLNKEFLIIEIGLFCGGEFKKRKYTDITDLKTRW